MDSTPPMPTDDSTRRDAQRILRGPWRHAEAALLACQKGAWADFARSAAPPKPVLLGRGDHTRCLALAESSLTGPVRVALTIVPLWACSAEDEGSSEWYAVFGLLDDAGALTVQETGPFIAMDDASPRAEAIWACTVQRWNAATVVESRAYAPDVPLLLRAGAFGVCAMQIEEVLEVEVRAAPARPRPTREVPMFSTAFEPRVEVDAELAAKIAALGFGAE